MPSPTYGDPPVFRHPLLPERDLRLDIGSSTKRYRSLYASFPDGSTGAPTIAFTSDTDLGFYRKSADFIALSATSGFQIENASGTGFLYISAAENTVQAATNVSADGCFTSGTAGFAFGGANGNIGRLQYLTELTTVAAAATTDTTIQFPAGSVGLGVTVRVTTVIPTATSFDVGIAGATNRYGATVNVAATTTNSGPSVNAYTSATAVRLTMNGGTPAANTGRVRVTLHYILLTPATS